MIQAELKLKRTVKLISVLTKYGFADIVARIRNTGHPQQENVLSTMTAKANHLSDYSLDERIRMVLEELGPTYVKLGQMCSTRNDIFPKSLVAEFQKLQDHVQTEDLQIKSLFQKEFNEDPDIIFSGLEEQPMAAASMSQVYAATLKKGNKKVVLKVKRPGINETVEADLSIMQDLIHILEKYNPDLRAYNLNIMLRSFGTSIRHELSLSHELTNMLRFAKNFEENEFIHVPAVYPAYSNDNILCMERIDGIKITDTEQLKKAHISLKRLADNGLQLYFSQILDFGFFHGDPHPGNLFALKNGKIVFIDFGNMGTLLPNEKALLEELIFFISKENSAEVVRILKKMAVKCKIEDNAKLQRQVADVFAMADTSALQKIDLGVIFDKFRDVFRENKILLPDYVFQLMRGFALIEGIGLKLVPDLNIMEALKPFEEKIIQERFNPANILHNGLDKFNIIRDTLENLPENVNALLQKVANNEIKINHSVDGMEEFQKTVKKQTDYLALAMIIMALSIGSAIMVHANMPPKLYGIPVLGFVGFIISGILGIYIVFSMLKK